MADGPVEIPARILELQRQGLHRDAVDLAKGLCKATPTADCAAMLVDVYGVRISALFAQGLWVEGASLLELVLARYPGAERRLIEWMVWRAVREDRLEHLAPWLADDGLRPRVERGLFRSIVDPAALARALPAGERLRLEAEAVARAFAGVTSGPVDDAALALPEVSRRSPLAPWKMLIRAIAWFHRGDARRVREALARIDSDSAPARLVPAIRALLDGVPPPAGAAALARALRGPDGLRQVLETLDEQFATERISAQRLLAQISEAVRSCAREMPGLSERLRQQISVRAWRAELPASKVRAAAGERVRKDAWFWRMFARVAERHSGSPALACQLWEEFRWHALRERWFAAGGLEQAAVLRHSAGLAERVDPQELLHIDSLAHYYADQPGELRRNAWPPLEELCDAGQLYRRACEIDPDPETFRRWLDWTRCTSRRPQEHDAVAEAWRRAVPGDARALVALGESAAARGAFKKALLALDQARRIDPLSAQTERTRCRVVWSMTLRHLSDGKPKLARQDLAALGQTGLPPTVRDALSVAVEWGALLLEGDELGTRRLLSELACRLGCELSARLLLRGVALAAGLSPAPAAPPPEDAPRAVTALAAARALGEAVGLDLPAPQELLPAVERAAESGLPADGAVWRRTAEAALAGELPRLAFTATVRAMTDRSCDLSRLLLLRAQSLPPSDWMRHRLCLAAAAELARRGQDHELADAVWEAARGPRRRGRRSGWEQLDLAERMQIDAEKLQQVVRLEREATTYEAGLYERSGLFAPSDGCNCAACRGLLDDETEEEMEWWQDEEELDLSPEEFAQLDPQRLIEMLLGTGPQGPTRRRRRR